MAGLILSCAGPGDPHTSNRAEMTVFARKSNEGFAGAHWLL